MRSMHFQDMNGAHLTNYEEHNTLSKLKNKNQTQTEYSPFYRLIKPRIDALENYAQNTSLRRSQQTLLEELKTLVENHIVNYGEGVVTRRFEDGEFILVDGNTLSQIAVSEGVDDLVGTEDDKEGNTKNENMVSQIHSRETLYTKLTAKLTERTELRVMLYLTFFLLSCIIIFASIIYSYSMIYLNAATSGLSNLSKVFDLGTEIQYSLFYSRQLNVIEKGFYTLKDYLANNMTIEEYKDYLKEKIKYHSENLYDLNDFLANEALIEVDEPELDDYYKENGVDIEYYITPTRIVHENCTLPEAILEFIAYLYESRYTADSNEWLYFYKFILDNGYNNIMQDALAANRGFLKNTELIAKNNIEIMLALTITAIVMITLYIPVFIFLVFALHSYSKRIFDLLLELPYKPLSELITRCEIFVKSLNIENYVEYDENDNTQTEKTHDYMSNYANDNGKRKRRKYRNTSKWLEYSSIAVFLVCGILSIYFGIYYYLETDYRGDYEFLLDEFNDTMRIESRNQMALNYLLECLYHKTGKVELTDENMCQRASQAIENGYELMKKIETIEIDAVLCTEKTISDLKQIFSENLCEIVKIYEPTIIKCEDLAQGTVTHGLKMILAYFLKMVRLISLSNENAIQILNSPEISHLYFLQRDYINKGIGDVMQILLDGEKESNISMTNIKIGILIAFIIGAVGIFIITWLFFINYLSDIVFLIIY